MSDEPENMNSYVLRIKHVHDPYLLQEQSFEDIWEHCEPSDNNWSLIFQNEIYTKDIKYLKHKYRQLRKKKYKKVLNGCVKIIQENESYIWAYIIAGATCRKYEKHCHDSLFYFSQATLLNPNCLTAWVCLSKYIKEYPYVDSIIFDTVFSGLLQIETNSERLCQTVTYFLELSNNILGSRRLQILSPLIFSSDNSKKLHIAKAISQHVLNHINDDYTFPELDLVMESFKINLNNNPDVSYAKQILSYTFCNAFFIQFDQLFKHYLKEIHIEEFGVLFLKKVIQLFSLTKYLSGNEIIHNITAIIPDRMHIKRKHQFRYFSIINFAYNDFRRTRDHYFARRKKARKLHCQDKLIGVWSFIKLGCYKSGWEVLSHCTKNLKKRLRRKPEYKKYILHTSHRDVWLYFLTHGPSISMRKLGVLLCLKLLNEKETSLIVMYYACIGCIGLGEDDLVLSLLTKLLKSGAINEVLLLKSLLEKNSLKNLLLKELVEFSISYEISAVESYNTEKGVKALKSICKASFFLPYNSVLYEWLGIYFYERGDYLKSEKYFEISLYYNPASWVSINYYSLLLAKHDAESSKLFLNLYRTEKFQNMKYTFSHLISFKSGLFYLRYHNQKFDFYKACENLRYGMQFTQNKRFFKEMLGEAYSLYGMVGVGMKWLRDCYIFKNKRNIYAGSQLGKQYLFTNGVSKYTKMMRSIVCKGGLETFISLHNAAHSFLLKTIHMRTKNKLHLSQIYCQKSLFMCVRALAISSIYPATWKILGDTLCLCGYLDHSMGYLFVPHWLLPGGSSNKIILIRRFQALKLAIRCYYSALSVTVHSKEMKASLWNSIAVVYKKISYLCPRSQTTHILHTGINCCLKALNENVKDCLSWNTLGVYLKELGAKHLEHIYPFAYAAFSISSRLSQIVQYRLISASNLAFLALSEGDYHQAYILFLSARGQCTSLDFPWVGQIFLNLIGGGPIRETLNQVRFLFEFTHYIPTIKMLFSYLLFLSHYFKRTRFYAYCKKISKYYVVNNISFNDFLLSSLVNLKKKQFGRAKLDLLYALRTCTGLKENGLQDYSTALYELSLLQTNDSSKNALLGLSSYLFDSLNTPFKQLNETLGDGQELTNLNDSTESTYVTLLKNLNHINNPKMVKTLYLALALLEYGHGDIKYAKYYYLKAQKVVREKKKKYKRHARVLS